ncbi:response regulator transcription factor [Pontiella agarivorans]|uniref:Response regulator transcription factor n=1 Tax=Pontiella agarivorans TaxID=3038953 RepID=A0ABU5MW65_9BACT|nr:response regulator transcription factor [Pontiella agarivorans]MDZ8118439.1 response regulator transcription factor [Pontiella agarivorans]
MDQSIRILIVDDNPMMRFGLRGSLSSEEEFKVIGEAASGEEALAFVREHRPDVVTMDYKMPGGNGIKATTAILKDVPETKIILLSVFDSEEDIWKAVRAGVRGYLTKTAGDVDELIDAVKTVASGREFYPEIIAKKLRERRKMSDLSPREIEVLKLLAEGHSNKEMAVMLGIADETVKAHLVNLRSKLGAADRTQAVVIAYEKGILHLNE